MTDVTNISIVLSAKGAEKVTRQLHSIKASGKTAAIALTGIATQLARIESKGLLGARKEMDKTTSASKKLEMQVKKLQTANQKLTAQNKRLQSSQNKVRDSTDKAGKGMRNLLPHVAAVTISYMAMRKAVRAVLETLKAGAEFEQQMAIVGGIVRATTSEFEMLAAAAREAGETTVWTATESANALRFLGMAGFDAAESIAALGGVLNLALIGEMELSRATDIATDTLRAFGLEASEIDRVVDVMVGTITRSNTNIEKMGHAMKFVAPVAAQLGYTVEQVSAMIGILSQSGIKAGIAGRALRMSFLRSIDAAKALGMESNNLVDILKELADRNMGAAKLTSTLKDLFGLRSTPAMLVLLRGIEQLDEFTETLNNSKGETDKFIERLDTTTVAFKKLASVVKDVAIEVFIAHAEDLTETIKELTQDINNSKESFMQFGRTVADVYGIVSKLIGLFAIATRMDEANEASRTFFELQKDGWIWITNYLNNVLPRAIANLATNKKKDPWTGLFGEGLVGAVGLEASVEMMRNAYNAWRAEIEATKYAVAELKKEQDRLADSAKAYQGLYSSLVEDVATEVILDELKAMGDDYSTAIDALFVGMDERHKTILANAINTLSEGFVEQLDDTEEYTVENVALHEHMYSTILTYAEELSKQLQASWASEWSLWARYQKSKLKTDKEVQTAIAKFDKNNLKEFEKNEKKKGNLLENSIAEQLKMTEDMYNDMKELYQRDFKYEAELIDQEAKLYKEAGISEIKIAEWVSYKKREILKESLIYYGGFFGGISSYLMTMQDEWQNAMQQIGQFGYDTFESIGVAFEDSVVLALKNDFEDIGDVWDALLDDMLDSFIRLVANLIKQWVFSGIANLVINVGGSAAGVTPGLGGGGIGGSGFSILDALGLAKSGYEMYSGNSLLGSLYNTVFGNGTTTLPSSIYGNAIGSTPGGMSGWGAGWGSAGLGGTGAAVGAVGGYGGIGAAGVMSGYGAGGMALTTGSSAWAAPAAIVAAVLVMAFEKFAEHQMLMSGGPSGLATRTDLYASQDPNRLFTGKMSKVFTTGGTWTAEDANNAAERVAGLIADTLDVYNILFSNLSEESKASAKAVFDLIDLENMELQFSQYASAGAPIEGSISRRTPNEISAMEWVNIQGAMSNKWIGEFTQLGGLSETMKESIIEAIEEGGDLTGEALADIMGVSYETLENAFQKEFSDGLGDFIKQINDAYKGGFEKVGDWGSIPEAFQSVFGEYFQEYVQEGLEGIKGKEIFGFMTDEIQAAFNELDVDLFINNINEFTDKFTETAFKIEMAGKVWESLEAFIGRSTDEVTVYEKATAKAQIEVAAYIAKLAEFGIELTEEEIVEKTKTIMDVLTDGIDDLEVAVKPLGMMGQLLAAYEGQWKAYLKALEDTGVAVEKITDLEILHAEGIERLLNEYKISLGLFGEDYLENLKLEEIAERYKQFGMSFQEMIDWFTDASLADIQAIAEALGIDWTDIADDIGWLFKVLKETGDAATEAASDFAALRDQITTMLSAISGTFGGADTAANLMTQITGLQSIPMSEQTTENLLSMSEKLIQWYRAAVAEAEAAAREEQEAARLLIQVADRISGLITQIDQTIRNIKYSPLNVSLPHQKAAESQQDYNKLLAAAQTGGTAEVQEYLGFAQTYLQQQQNEYKSSPAYQDLYASVMADMEAIKAKAVAGGYDAQILAELKKGHTDIHVDLSGIQATFSEFEGWILNALQTLEDLDMIINIDWGNWTGDMNDALEMLLQLVEVYGWDHEYTLKFLAEVPLHIFEDLDDLAMAAGWVADQSGGWNSLATISFIKNVAANWEFENLDEIFMAANYIKDKAGSWSADASIAFIATLQDRFGVDLVDMPYWLDQMGLSETEIPDVMLKLILQAYSATDMIDNIDEFLLSIGIEDTILRKNLEIQLIYSFVSSGDMDASAAADWAYATAMAGVASGNDAIAISMLEQVKKLGFMFGWQDAYNLGGAIQTYSPLAQEGGWTSWAQAASAFHGLFESLGMATHWAEGGIATQPTWGVFGEAGPEAFLRLADNRYTPAYIPNGGSTQAGANRGEEIALLREEVSLLRIIVAQNGRPIEIGGEPLDRHAKRNADDVIKQRVRSGNLDSPDTFFR